MQAVATYMQDQFLKYAQLHSAPAGASRTDNVAASARVSISWVSPHNYGDFELSDQLAFGGGTPGGDVYSLTIWDAATNGTAYGEFPVTDGDLTLNSNGDYYITVADWAGIFESGS